MMYSDITRPRNSSGVTRCTNTTVTAIKLAWVAPASTPPVTAMCGVEARPMTNIERPLPMPTRKNMRPKAASLWIIETMSVPMIAPAPMPTMMAL